jgi:LacI family transcriptional regulator
MPRVTQADIAKSLGISLKTVQRAFRAPDSVSERLRREIFEHAQERGYRHDRAAQALQRKSTRRLAIVTADSPSYFWDDIRTGVDLARSQIEYLGFEVEYLTVRLGDQVGYDTAIAELIRRGTDVFGLVNHIGFDMRRTVDSLARAGKPFAAFNIDFDIPERIAYVGPDYHQQGDLAGELVSKLMVGNERKRILVLTGSDHGVNIIPGADIQTSKIRGFRERIARSLPDADMVEIPLIEDGVVVPWDLVRKALPDDTSPSDVLFCIPPFPEPLLDWAADRPVEARPRIVGFDVSPRITRYLETGVITAEIFQSPAFQGYAIVKLIEAWLESSAFPVGRRFLVTSEVILESNSHQKLNLDMLAEISAIAETVDPPVGRAAVRQRTLA